MERKTFFFFFFGGLQLDTRLPKSCSLWLVTRPAAAAPSARIYLACNLLNSVACSCSPMRPPHNQAQQLAFTQVWQLFFPSLVITHSLYLLKKRKWIKKYWLNWNKSTFKYRNDSDTCGRSISGHGLWRHLMFRAWIWLGKMGKTQEEQRKRG